MLSLRERRKQMLRDEILQAARQMVIEKGYAAVSMDELAARVGISKPTLYSHFATKEDLVVMAAQQSMQQMMTVIESELTDNAPLQNLLLLLRTTIRILSEEGVTTSRPMTPELMHLVRSRKETRAWLERIDAAILELIQQGIQQGEIDPALDPVAVLLAFHGLIHGLKMDTVLMREVYASNLTDMMHSLATIFERGVRNVQPPEQGPAPNGQPAGDTV